MYMIFPVRGGRYNGVNKRIKKHEKTPISSTERIFIRSCRTGMAEKVMLLGERVRERGYWVVFYSSPQSFMIPNVFFYLLAQ